MRPSRWDVWTSGGFAVAYFACGVWRFAVGAWVAGMLFVAMAGFFVLLAAVEERRFRRRHREWTVRMAELIERHRAAAQAVREWADRRRKAPLN